MRSRMMKQMTAGGGWPAIWYTLKKARAAGGVVRMVRALSSRNACKTCALGMGGQQGGMRNEAGRFPEVCKKSVQAMAADMQGRIRAGFFDEFSFDKLERMSPRELEAAGRLTEPLVAGPGDESYRPVSWDEALRLVTQRMGAAPRDETFFYFSGRSSNEAGFLLQVVARVYGTNNVNNCSYFCHQASGVGLSSVTGSGTATITLEDLDACDLVFVIGGNPASNHPRLMRTLVDLKRRGGKVVVANPLREIGLVNFRVPSDVRSMLFGSKIADEYIQPHIGGDIALLTGMARALLDRGATDEQYIADHTDGWEAFRAAVMETDWGVIESSSGVPRHQIERAAGMYAAARRAVFCWTMGITHHEHGVANVQMIANLALMRGMVGRAGAGLLPLRGHSNVQGIGSMGAVPELKGSVLGRLEEVLGVSLPRTPGMDTLSCVSKAGSGGVRFALHLGGNLFGSCPDAAAAERSLRQIDTTVFMSTTLNTGHARGRGRTSIILPVRARDEETQATTQESMFNFVRLSDGGRARHEGPRSEVEVIAQIAEGVMGHRGPLDFTALRRHDEIRSLIARVVPGYGGAADIGRTRKEFAVAGRTFHQPRFTTETGRARFHAVRVPALKEMGSGEFRLMTIRSEGQFNTVVYEEGDVYRAQERRDVVLMVAADMLRLGLRRDDRVTVRSAAGEMADLLAREAPIREGNAAMYYPEANVLVPAAVDSASRTPAFKNVIVRIEKCRRLAVAPRG
ncbi:MAG: FdhF/YdeP family oxidoreductase [Phycisphaeraceae bacterium]|nr:FdhF/YdeP family oxidoreductase [Phycisphaeraceae bacterium]